MVSGDTTSGATVLFPYHQRRLMYSRNPNGGLAYVSAGAVRGAPLPVVVFLHGMNSDERIHPWFGPPYGDLRPLIESLVASGKVAPLVVAAPTHTRYATGATVMWPRFDLDDFLGATEAALGDTWKLDRSRVLLVGHSAAGCNATGGLFAERPRDRKLLGLIDVDGCLDDSIATQLAEAASSTRVQFFWQHTWPRPTAELPQLCPACKVVEIVGLPSGTSPHLSILPAALRRVLPEFFPAEQNHRASL
jgi:hypothetical protein